MQVIILDSVKSMSVFDHLDVKYYQSAKFEVISPVVVDAFTSNKDRFFETTAFLVKHASGIDKLVTEDKERVGLGNIKGKGLVDKIRITDGGTYSFVIPKKYEHIFKDTKLQLVVNDAY